MGTLLDNLTVFEDDNPGEKLAHFHLTYVLKTYKSADAIVCKQVTMFSYLYWNRTGGTLRTESRCAIDREERPSWRFCRAFWMSFSVEVSNALVQVRN